MTEEELLVSKLKTYDIKAFETLVSDYEKRVFNFAYGFTQNKEDAMDISQEVFLKIYKNIDKFKQKSSLSTWIYRITNNVCIDFSRKNKNAKVIPITDENREAIDAISDNKNQPEDRLLKLELSEEIAMSLNTLDYEAKQIVVMRDVLGLSYKEIGQILKLEEGTVKSRISRSRRKLRDNIIRNRNFLKKTLSK